MEPLLLRVVVMINEQALQLSKDEAFLSLSLSNLVSLISQKGLVHNASLLQSCIQWALADESSRKHEFSTLLRHFCLAEYNPAYLKQMLNTYSKTLITDPAMQQEIINVITSSFYYVDIQHLGKDNEKLARIFHFNPTSHTLMNIGTVHGRLPWPHLLGGKCMTELDIFCSDGIHCALLNLVNLKVTHLPSLPESAEIVQAVAMRTKVFIYVIVPFEKRKMHFDHWQDCSSAELYASYGACIACVDTSIFLMLPVSISSLLRTVLSSGLVGKLLCYDLKKQHKSDTADSPANVKQSACALSESSCACALSESSCALSPESTKKEKFLCYDTVKKSFSCRPKPPYEICRLFEPIHAVTINKDIYFWNRRNGVFHYSTTEDSWTRIASPGTYGHPFCMKGKLAVLRLHDQDEDPMEDEPSEKFDLAVLRLHDQDEDPMEDEPSEKFDLILYDNATDTWELSSLNLGLKLRWESFYEVFSSY